MIETSIVKWIELEENLQINDAYISKKWEKLFRIFKVLLDNKKFSIFFYLVLKIFFFVQIWLLNLTQLPNIDEDNALKMLNYIQKLIFIQEIVQDGSSYKIFLTLNITITALYIISVLYVIHSIKIGKFVTDIPITYLNTISVVVMNYFIGPFIQLNLLFLSCNATGMHTFLLTTCYSSQEHIIYTIISVFNLIFYLLLSIFLSIYYNELGSLSEAKLLSRVNCSYEFLTNISKISQFLFAYIFQNYYPNNEIMAVVFRVYMLVNSIFFSLYVYKNILFFDKTIHNTVLYGWVFTSWFAFIVFFKIVLKLNDTLIYIVAGAILMAAIVSYLDDLRTEELLTNFNLSEQNSLKTIELYINNIYSLMNQKSTKDKILLHGILKSFEDGLVQNTEMLQKFNRLKSNPHLVKKYNNNNLTIHILCMIYLIYDYNLEKATHNKDILLNFCYFLINRFKNVNLAMYLCSRTKCSDRIVYFKYILLEEIKDYLSTKLNSTDNNKNKETIKTIQIGSVILYNIYCDNFKRLISQAVNVQSDYFELLKQPQLQEGSTETFLEVGEKVISLRNDILKLWSKIIELNPFSDSIFREFEYYFGSILQDELLIRNEPKKFNNLHSFMIF